MEPFATLSAKPHGGSPAKPSPGPLPFRMLDGERIPGKFSRVEPLNRVGTARCAVRAAFSGATIPPAVSRAGTSQRDVPTTVRFMGRVGVKGAFNRIVGEERTAARSAVGRSLPPEPMLSRSAIRHAPHAGFRGGSSNEDVTLPNLADCAGRRTALPRRDSAISYLVHPIPCGGLRRPAARLHLAG